MSRELVMLSWKVGRNILQRQPGVHAYVFLLKHGQIKQLSNSLLDNCLRVQFRATNQLVEYRANKAGAKEQMTWLGNQVKKQIAFRTRCY